MGYFLVLHPTRLLDSLHRNPSLQAFPVRPRLPLAPMSLFQSAVPLLGPAPTSTLSPVTVTWEARRLQRDAKAVMSISALVAYLLLTRLRPDSRYTDGSKMGSPPFSRAAAIMPNGLVAVCRVPGLPDSYKAELVGLLLRSHLFGEGDRLRLDCQGAIASAISQRRPVRQAYWVQAVRHGTAAKSQNFDCVEGHCGHALNEEADKYAKIGTALPPHPRGTWYVMVSQSCDHIKPGVMILRPATPTRVFTPCRGGLCVSGAWPGTSGFLGSNLDWVMPTTPPSGPTRRHPMSARTVDTGTTSVFMDSSPTVLKTTPWYPHGLLPGPPIHMPPSGVNLPRGLICDLLGTSQSQSRSIASLLPD